MYIQVLGMHLNIQVLATKILGIYIVCQYESKHRIQVLDMYLNIQVLGTCMPGIYISSQYATVHSKYKIINSALVY